MQQKLQNKANTLLLVFQREWMFKKRGGGEKYSQALKINKTLHSPSGIMCIHDGFFLFAAFTSYLQCLHFLFTAFTFLFAAFNFFFAAFSFYSQRSFVIRSDHFFICSNFFYFKCSLFFFNHLQAFFSVPSIHCFHFVVLHCPVHSNKF